MAKKEPKIRLDVSGSFITNIKSKVIIDSRIEIQGTGTSLPLTIIADFEDIPTELHGQYLRVLDSQYNKDINVYANIEPVHKAEVKPKWYQRLFNLK